jgi:hypothetical protein
MSLESARPSSVIEAGDGHTGLGNCEVDITAFKTLLTGRFEFMLRPVEELSMGQATAGENPV